MERGQSERLFDRLLERLNDLSATEAALWFAAGLVAGPLIEACFLLRRWWSQLLRTWVRRLVGLPSGSSGPRGYTPRRRSA